MNLDYLHSLGEARQVQITGRINSNLAVVSEPATSLFDTQGSKE